jgi:ATP-binding cassette, subfamily B, bacterial
LTNFGVIGNPSITTQKIKPGTVRRVFPYAWRYRWGLAVLLIVTVGDSVITVANPLLLRILIDNGILRRRAEIVLAVGVVVALLALVDSLLLLVQGWKSASIGQGLTYDLRMQVFAHVQDQPIAFFARTQTGSLVSRLNTDVVSAQQAITTLLSSVVSSLLSIVLILIAMVLLDWYVAVLAVVTIPIFILLARFVGRRLQRLVREQMQRTAEMASTMNERFNVAGAMLAKLFGRPDEEIDRFSHRAVRVRDNGVMTALYGRGLYLALNLLAALATAVVYGAGGILIIGGRFQIGTLVALVALLNRIYGPVTQLSNVQVNTMTALVSFDRTFEVLDLKPLIVERPGATAFPPVSSGSGTAPAVEFDLVSFRYPVAGEVALASLESIARPEVLRESSEGVLHDVSFVAPAGQLTALVGHSGAGKTTITHLVSRMYDPNAGSVRIAGYDLRDVTLASLRNTVGVVTQEAHMFHDTIRNNLAYAWPEASEKELIEACRAAQIWDLISSLSEGLDTVVGDRGYRLSGGEKQRVALARLLLKGPSVVVLDEATAHLDSESETAVQRALKTALAGRTSLVIAHRLATVREAHQILVIEKGRVAQRGTHEQLIAEGGLYADLYRTQFAEPRPDGANGYGYTMGPDRAAPSESRAAGRHRRRQL